MATSKPKKSRRRPEEEIEIAGIRLVYIQPGEFRMGSPEDDPYRKDDEQPQHSIVISKGFYLAACPTTQATYQDATGKNIADNRGDLELPVESVNRFTALRFCQTLREQTGYDVRLPTEAEWEYACRAGADTRYFWGSDAAGLDEHAWYGDNAEDQIHPVGQKEPNPWGLYDILGNVWEWCSDWYGPDYYAHSPMRDPTGPNVGLYGVVRGGSYINPPRRLGCATRGVTYPEVGRSRYGIRICVTF